MKNDKIEQIYIFQALKQLERFIFPPLIVNIDAKEGNYVDKKGPKDRRRSNASLEGKKRQFGHQFLHASVLLIVNNTQSG